jgi:hypothetical protein
MRRASVCSLGQRSSRHKLSPPYPQPTPSLITSIAGWRPAQSNQPTPSTIAHAHVPTPALTGIPTTAMAPPRRRPLPPSSTNTPINPVTQMHASARTSAASFATFNYQRPRTQHLCRIGDADFSSAVQLGSIMTPPLRAHETTT